MCSHASTAVNFPHPPLFFLSLFVFTLVYPPFIFLLYRRVHLIVLHFSNNKLLTESYFRIFRISLPFEVAAFFQRRFSRFDHPPRAIEARQPRPGFLFPGFVTRRGAKLEGSNDGAALIMHIRRRSGKCIRNGGGGGTRNRGLFSTDDPSAIRG